MNKKIKTIDLNLNVSTGTMLYVDIDIFRFLHDKGTFCITVQFLDGENYEFLEEINLEKGKSNLDHNDLKGIGLNWISNNVEVVSNLEKEVAPEVSVREQNIIQVARQLLWLQFKKLATRNEICESEFRNMIELYSILFPYHP